MAITTTVLPTMSAGAVGSSYSPFDNSGITMGTVIANSSGNLSPFPAIQDVPLNIIKGELLTAETLVYDAALQLPLLDKDKIRRKLAEELVEKLLTGKYIEFTQQRIPEQDAIAIRARCYILPDSQVKIVRDKV